MNFKHPPEFYRDEARAIGREQAEYETWQRRNGYGKRNTNSNGNGHGKANGTTTPFAGGIGRAVTLTTASTIPVHPVKWAWQDRVPLGALTLVGGREGIGKSITVYTLAADLTRGRLPGIYHGSPRAVIVVATEDSWGHTIVPRLMAAGADLELVSRAEVMASGTITTLSLPLDLPGLEQAITQVQAALVILDPLLSRLDAHLDSHKDAEVRQGLEPLVAMAERTSTAFAGLIHVNKSGSDDPLTMLMASRAFAAVARSVLFVMADPDHEGTRLLGQAKNNLGRMDLPTLAFTISGTVVAETAEGPVWTGKLAWNGESDRSIHEALQATAEASGCNRTVVAEASDWLRDYLASQGGSADSALVKRDGTKAGHGVNAIQRARLKLKLTTLTSGFPCRTIWKLPAEVQLSHTPGESATTETTETTAAKQHFSEAPAEAQSSQLSQLSQLYRAPPARETTGASTPTIPAFDPKGWK